MTRRRAAELKHREGRIEGDIAGAAGGPERGSPDRRSASSSARGGDRTPRSRPKPGVDFLNAQAALPASSRFRRSEPGEGRDYAALAGLAGFGREEYERLDPRGQRLARLEVDRELAARKELARTAEDLAAADGSTPLGRRERQRLDRAFDSTLKQRMRDAGHGMPSSLQKQSSIDLWRKQGRAGGGSGGRRESSVMRDAHEVAARRKRQLGRDSPLTSPSNARASPGRHSQTGTAGTRRCTRRGCRRAGDHGVDGSSPRSRSRSAPAAATEAPPLETTESRPSRSAKFLRQYLRLYEESAQRYGLDWAILAGIGRVECDHGRDPDPSCSREGAVNSAGAGGPMQFIASTWARYGVDGDGDGRIDRWDPRTPSRGPPIIFVPRVLRATTHGRFSPTTTPAGTSTAVERWAARYRAPAASAAPLGGGESGEGEGADRALEGAEPDTRAVPRRRTRGARAGGRPPRAHPSRRPREGAGDDRRRQRAAGTSVRSGRPSRPPGRLRRGLLEHGQLRPVPLGRPPHLRNREGQSARPGLRRLGSARAGPLGDDLRNHRDQLLTFS